jgi:hypothetical protein
MFFTSQSKASKLTYLSTLMKTYDQGNYDSASLIALSGQGITMGWGARFYLIDGRTATTALRQLPMGYRDLDHGETGDRQTGKNQRSDDHN